ncbi:helix-turn-helix transcriptional regulator [Polaribacter sp.]|uniref:helix-turn-helix domain-containing protein n=1 Tax=Polaribacter sp. TaxID=1920175 RepID=UPI0026020A8C|nr:helix-turn-helix transcriptional regulator [Polaribacter sp.]MDG1403876.1 helix-turn-helix transcriptional regulator [Polaribacter sp.]
MNNDNQFRKRILNQSSYWVEGINGSLYDSIINYMEDHNLNRTKLATHLGISKGRVSQILNDGEINFSLEKIIDIALKVDKFPVFDFIKKSDYIKSENSENISKNIFIDYNPLDFSKIVSDSEDSKEVKVITLESNYQANLELAAF